MRIDENIPLPLSILCTFRYTTKEILISEFVSGSKILSSQGCKNVQYEIYALKQIDFYSFKSLFSEKRCETFKLHI